MRIYIAIQNKEDNMNKVYISGIIAEDPRLVGAAGGKAHLVFPIIVVHKARAGMKSEIYRIHAWDRAAAWGMKNLSANQSVVVQGYLTQRASSSGGTAHIVVAVTAQEFIPGILRQGMRGGEEMKEED